MIEAVKLKGGMSFVQDGKLIKVISADHHKPGKGNTVMRLKLKNMRTGAIVDSTMHPDVKLEPAIIDKKNAQYLYTQGDNAVFMDMENYNQYEVPLKLIEDEQKYLSENMNVQIDFYGSEIVGINLPTTVTLTVESTEPTIKGATATAAGKPATMNTGLVVSVPGFINTGDVLEINTADGSYVKRANK